ncbi:unnamed protein product [Ostreobium quekettii]|uniref:BZIP domain-containing protein n=1 Tax=Ostreobium quekettii TaxID=121088 RepID=A0A8S1IX10_9CHLO|nr:unnamed protein product [Ostreobium quekettii]
MFVLPFMPTVPAHQPEVECPSPADGAGDVAAGTVLIGGSSCKPTPGVVLLTTERADAMPRWQWAWRPEEGPEEEAVSEERADTLAELHGRGILDSGFPKCSGESMDANVGEASCLTAPDPAPEDAGGRLTRKRGRRASWSAGFPGFKEDVARDERRKERNRRAQKTFREKQKRRIAALEGETVSLSASVRSLEVENAQLTNENAILKDCLQQSQQRQTGGDSGEPMDVRPSAN